MKVAIAADLSPDKIGSLEDMIFSIGRSLTGKGIEVAHVFNGGLSDSVRLYYRLDDTTIASNLGSPDQPASQMKWVDCLRRQKPDVILYIFIPPHHPIWRPFRSSPGRTRTVYWDGVSREISRRSALIHATQRIRSILSGGQYIGEYIAVSHYIAQRLVTDRHIPKEKIHVVYNAIDLDRFTPGCSSGSTVVSICNMIPEKGIPVLLDALAILRSQQREPPSVLVGAGVHLEEYQRRAEQLGLSQVRFLGSRDDVPVLLRDAAVAVIPSVWQEAFGLAAAEAQAMKVPVIASDVGGLPEVIEHEVTGLLVPPSDPRSLADAIATLLDDDERRRSMGEAGRARVERLFNLTSMTERMVEIVLSGA